METAPTPPPKITVALLDARHRAVGGIRTLNDDLEKSILCEEFDFTHSGLHELAGFLLRHRSAQPLICLFDESFSWRSLPRLYLAFALRWWLARHGWICRFVAREHHYSRSFVDHCVPHRRRFEFMLRLAYHPMDRVISLSSGQAQWFRERRLCPESKLHVVTHAVDLERFLQVTVKPPSHPLVFGFLGRLTFQKGVDLLLQSWAALPGDCAAELLIGGSGPQETSLRARADGLRGVTFLGEVKDRALFYERCDVIVIPSRYETGTQVCKEARAAARPFIASAIDCFPEQPSDCCLLFPSGDIASLRDCLLQMVSAVETGQYASMAEASRRSAPSLLEGYLPQFSALLHQLLAVGSGALQSPAAEF